MKLRFNLFWKIFLWLWLTLILFIVVHFIVTGYAQDQIHIEALPDTALPAYRVITKRLESFHFSGGASSSAGGKRLDMHFRIGPLDERLPPPPPSLFYRDEADNGPATISPPPALVFRDERGEGIHGRPLRPDLLFPPDKQDLFFLDKQGKEIYGKPVDHILLLLHNQYLTDRRPRVAYKQRNFFTGPFVIKQDGKVRYVYSHRRLNNLGEERLKLIWSQAPKHLLLSAVLITFPLCFALAWYLSSPIHRLQKAAREFSSTQKVPAQITPLLKRGDEFGDLARDFKNMAGQIQTAFESQKHLLSDVSHELRSPLARLRIALGLVEQKMEGNPVSAHRKEIDQMILECGRIDSLIEQLLDIARLDSASSNIETTEFELCELLLATKKDVELEAAQKHVTLRDHIPTQHIVNGVPSLLRSAVENVLRNAVQHAPPDSEIGIQLCVNKVFLELTISDRGPGVAEEHIDKIFEPFYRPQYARERDSGGSGLGLAIAKRSIEYHGGRIQAENISGGGFQVNILLPRVPE